MTELRAELKTIVEQLIEASEASREVSLDAIGLAIGVRAVTIPEIDAMITALEEQGRHVEATIDGKGEELLLSVLGSLRALGPQLGRRPSTAEIAEHAGLSTEQVRHALLLAQVMQR